MFKSNLSFDSFCYPCDVTSQCDIPVHVVPFMPYNSYVFVFLNKYCKEIHWKSRKNVVIHTISILFLKSIAWTKLLKDTCASSVRHWRSSKSEKAMPTWGAEGDKGQKPYLTKDTASGSHSQNVTRQSSCVRPESDILALQIPLILLPTNSILLCTFTIYILSWLYTWSLNADHRHLKLYGMVIRP